MIKKASVFGESSDSDEAEEMPPEARMRMKNIGRYVVSVQVKIFE